MASEFDIVSARLASQGIQCDDVYRLLRDRDALKRATPVLQALLRELNSPTVKVDLVRVLTSANVSAQLFLDEFDRLRPSLRGAPEDTQALAWALGDAVAAKTTPSMFDAVLQRFRDSEFGRARAILAFGLARVKSRRGDAIAALIDIADDEDIGAQAISALAKLKASEAIPVIERSLSHPNAVIRKEAAKALKQIQRRPVRSGPKPGARQFSGMPTSAMREVSANVDLDDLGAMLKRLCVAVEGGFAEGDAARVLATIDRAEVEDEFTFDFSARFHGTDVPLTLRVHINDYDAAHVSILTHPNLATELESAIEK